MKRYRSGSITVTVDASEALDEIEDTELLREVQMRKLHLTSLETPDIEIVRDAYEELLRGRKAAALSLLDRLLNPKWPSVGACETALSSTVGKET